MSNAVEQIIANFTSIPFVAGFLVVFLIVIAIAKFTDALEKIHGFYQRAFGNKALSEPVPAWHTQFEILRRNIIYCNIANDLPVQLNKLRKFFIETGLVERSEINQYYARWLNDPVLSMGIPVLRYSLEEIVALKEEL
ncbi:MAG TPA: hypothetical protein VGK47_12455, partial [Nitrososphaeraceae archaeon]